MALNTKTSRMFEKHERRRIAKAWNMYLEKVHGYKLSSRDKNYAKGIRMTYDEALEIVNRESAKHGQPEAVDPQFKMDEFWEGLPI